MSDDWRALARCRSEEPELFFPIGNGPAALDQTARAKAVCYGCDVVVDCLQWALALGDTEGVMGGLSGEERQVMLRRRQVVPA